MNTRGKIVRRSVTMPATLAKRVGSMAKSRRTSASRMLVELVEDGIEMREMKEKAFFDLAERFRAAEDPKEAQRLGDQLGRLVFGKSSG